MSSQCVNIVFGGTRIGNREAFKPENGLENFFRILAEHNVITIDTAQSYGESQATIEHVKAGDRFTIDTKWSPPWDEAPRAWATAAQIVVSAKASIQQLGVKQVDVFYLHRPDPMTPICETLSAVNDVYKLGLFRRLGLSGFPAIDVESIYNHCISNDFPVPKVYQGSYNPLSRRKETNLLPSLRRCGIAFYAYGPSAGGFLGKTVAQVKEMSCDLATVSATCRPYVADARYLEVLAKWTAIADDEGVHGTELAYRWMAYHSALSREHGDALIIGASSPEQLEETLAGIEKGPLSVKACIEIHEIWEGLESQT